jgi:hypothetical protein
MVRPVVRREEQTMTMSRFVRIATMATALLVTSAAAAQTTLKLGFATAGKAQGG